MDRLISLSVGTEGAEDYASTFMDVAELARGLGANHSYLNVSAQLITDDEIPDALIVPEPAVVEEDIIDNKLTFDESTVITVRRAISRALYEAGLSSIALDVSPASVLVTDVINQLQNAGILFRERPNVRGE